LAERLPDDSVEEGQGGHPGGCEEGRAAGRTLRTAACGVRGLRSRNPLQGSGAREREGL
jgi:hypothetical protein